MKQNNSSNEEPLLHLQREHERLVATRDKQLDNFARAVTSGSRRRLPKLCAGIRQTNEFLQTLEQIGAGLTPWTTEAKVRYTVSSAFLYDCFKKLTADRYEEFFFVTGPEINGALILDQWAEFEKEKRTVTAVVADMRSTHKALIRLEELGHRLLGHMHSHPGNGPSATTPSTTDLNFQKRLEVAGHIAVMAIFSRDGFIRFLRLDGIPEVEIYGKGVDKHDAEGTVFRLTEAY